MLFSHLHRRLNAVRVKLKQNDFTHFTSFILASLLFVSCQGKPFSVKISKNFIISSKNYEKKGLNVPLECYNCNTNYLKCGYGKKYILKINGSFYPCTRTLTWFTFFTQEENLVQDLLQLRKILLVERSCEI